MTQLQLLSPDDPEAQVAPRYLTLWPLDKDGYFGDGVTVKPAYRFGEQTMNQLVLANGEMELASIFPLYNANVVLSAGYGNRAEMVRVADSLAEVVNTWKPEIEALTVQLVGNAGGGLEQTGSAFQQISSELSYWSALGTVPPSIIGSVVSFSREWEDTCFEASSRFSKVSELLKNSQDYLTKLLSTERAIRIKAQESAEIEIARLQQEVDNLRASRSTLENLAHAFRKWADDAKAVARDTIDSIGKHAGVIAGGAVFGGATALVLYGGAAAAALYFMSRRRR